MDRTALGEAGRDTGADIREGHGEAYQPSTDLWKSRIARRAFDCLLLIPTASSDSITQLAAMALAIRRFGGPRAKVRR
jgi:hypothetical protein